MCLGLSSALDTFRDMVRPTTNSGHRSITKCRVSIPKALCNRSGDIDPNDSIKSYCRNSAYLLGTKKDAENPLGNDKA